MSIPAADKRLLVILSRRVAGRARRNEPGGGQGGGGGVGSGRIVRRYHFHAPGVLYVAVTLFLALGAINSQNNLLFAALGLAIGGLLVSGIISGASLLGLRVERDPIVHASVGAPLTVSYTISNTNRFFPAFGLGVMELPGRNAQGWQRAMPSRARSWPTSGRGARPAPRPSSRPRSAAASSSPASASGRPSPSVSRASR